MASQNPNSSRTSMYPRVVIDQNTPLPSSSRQNLYPTINMNDLVDQNTPEEKHYSPSAPPETIEETLLTIPGSILHLIDKNYSVELATGDLFLHRIRQGNNIVAVLVRVGNEIQWPLTKDLASVKLDDSHYFFSFQAPKDDDDESDKESNDSLNYGLTIASKGQEKLLRELDGILENYSNFTVQKVEEKVAVALGGPVDLKSEKKEVLEGRCAAYWTTLAPNVEEYNAKAAKYVASGSGHLIKGILWCGDVTADRLKWGNDVLKDKFKAGSKAEVSPETLKRIKRVKRVTKMTEKVAVGVLSGAVKVSGFFTRSVANSKAGKKFFSLLPGEMVLATLDGFSRICDAVEVAGKNVMSTSNTVTTEFVSHRYGEEAAKATTEGLDAAGHAFGTAWAVFKIRQALNPKSALKPTALAKSAAKAAAAAAKADKKAKSSK
ncbi:protein EARLY-RESPONSIVE TO DEHYDRATION 7, chloroplastic-like [Lycium barbarum]|uniref:protein EARLY-RESPONSIVE TO DEHYDRATION 7, chloroplastic-like n=1 Tax=Lycium barbarum TaxID=112863 RepID=UPI00293F2823|nr:protein EARLY-RESPONSIVE TO DEHYDRATION 7, chloroplastic-like [Lycium barbarum]XP_060195848.1 protein EARLY-RESPONSIVE TO DEHYDRATION 7, chloroplastic-like [Lycium barbarum]